MRIAVYGGSFNPPHIAHTMVASWLLWTEMVDEVWLVPVYRHAFEQTHGKKLAPYSMRVQWCNALSTLNPRIMCSTIEETLPTPSYTIDTLKSFSEMHPDYQFRLCIGADVLPQLDKWKDWATIKSEFSPIVVGRPGHLGPERSVQFADVSSTQIRQMLQAKEYPHHLVPAPVLKLIIENNPYALQ